MNTDKHRLKRVFRFAGFFLVAATACAQSDQPFSISVDLNLVVLPVTVLDRKGGFATDLQQQNFDVFEDGVKQSIRLFRHDDIPVTVGLVVDHSGSMRRKMDDVLEAAKTFAKLSNPEDQIFVVNFNERVMLGLPESSPFTDSPDALGNAILNAPLAGETALYDAVDAALRKLSAGNHDKKALIVISDGGDNASSTTFPWLLKKAAESNAMIYTVGIFDPADEDQNPTVLRKLSKETGGESFFPAKFEDAVADLTKVADEIRHQYTIGYVSTNAASGHHALRVVANGFTVRTRTGYIK